ncbi:Phytocyanin domain [Dillenia turbinata]|uniref:Phytocyanin domain n=1 Tax=Dillenia turbinata TaxID=194707 RepID=A0AAN8VMT1_9MAGN
MVEFSTSFYQFLVGDEMGWTKPTDDTHVYNDWAQRNRFHVGDSIYFRYENDSVLVVESNDYHNCITSDPIYKFEDGNTFFRFDRYGFFYFISGVPGHCQAGQKMIIRVMVHPQVEPRSPEASSPKVAAGGPGGWDLGPASMNSTTRLASYFMTALGGVLVILYLLM